MSSSGLKESGLGLGPGRVVDPDAISRLEFFASKASGLALVEAAR